MSLRHIIENYNTPTTRCRKILLCHKIVILFANIGILCYTWPIACDKPLKWALLLDTIRRIFVLVVLRYFARLFLRNTTNIDRSFIHWNNRLRAQWPQNRRDAQLRQQMQNGRAILHDEEQGMGRAARIAARAAAIRGGHVPQRMEGLSIFHMICCCFYRWCACNNSANAYLSITAWVHRIVQILWITTFLIMNIFYYSADTCSHTNPVLSWVVFAHLIVFYVVLGVTLITVILIACLTVWTYYQTRENSDVPFWQGILRTWHVLSGSDPNALISAAARRPAPPQLISSFPTRIFSSSDPKPPKPFNILEDAEQKEPLESDITTSVKNSQKSLRVKFQKKFQQSNDNDYNTPLNSTDNSNRPTMTVKDSSRSPEMESVNKPLIDNPINPIDEEDKENIGKSSQREHSPLHTDSQSDSDISESNDEQCGICLLQYTDGDVIRELPCAHEFHATCIDQWLSIHRTCPFCRYDVTVGTDHHSPPNNVASVAAADDSNNNNNSASADAILPNLAAVGMADSTRINTPDYRGAPIHTIVTLEDAVVQPSPHSDANDIVLDFDDDDTVEAERQRQRDTVFNTNEIQW